ncbi:MAG: hypothetical protein OEX14_02640 [Paracoccaceae bacterium]|nr:hypothetical protein [Paracoccaceae bacterium]
METKTLIGALVRHLLGIAAGGMMTNGLVTASEVETVAGAISAIVVVAWSFWQKKQAAK